MREETIKQQARILLVEDDAAMVELLEELLRRDGYTHIRSVQDPRQAPAAFRDLRPDLIILDLHMPHWTGFVLLEELRAELEQEKYLPVLMLTGDPSPDVKNQALVLGVKDFLSKPPDLFEARYRIWNLIHTRFVCRELQEQLQERESLRSGSADAPGTHNGGADQS
jgi:putative two-component system response regulator